MARRPAKVVTGLAGPQHRAAERPQDLTEERSEALSPMAKAEERVARLSDSQRPRQLLPKQAGKEALAVYHCRYDGAIYQLTSPADRRDEHGNLVRARPLKLKFTEGRAVVYDETANKLIRDHAQFNVEFWDAEEQRAAVQAKRKSSLREQLMKSPELLKELLRDMGTGRLDHSVPSPADEEDADARNGQEA